jgi:hypothetical protein
VKKADNSELKELSRRIATERDPEKLVALAKELDQWTARGDCRAQENQGERRRMIRANRGDHR